MIPLLRDRPQHDRVGHCDREKHAEEDALSPGVHGREPYWGTAIGVKRCVGKPPAIVDGVVYACAEDHGPDGGFGREWMELEEATK